MIHVHLIASRTEDEDDPHGSAFVKKMEEINKKGRVNITVSRASIDCNKFDSIKNILHPTLRSRTTILKTGQTSPKEKCIYGVVLADAGTLCHISALLSHERRQNRTILTAIY